MHLTWPLVYLILTVVLTWQVGGQTKEQIFTLLSQTEHSCVCVPCALWPPVPCACVYQHVIIFHRIPTYSFRRTSVSYTSLCREESSFSSSSTAGSTAGLHLHKLWVLNANCKIRCHVDMNCGRNLFLFLFYPLLCLVAQQSQTSISIRRWGADWGCVCWACCVSTAQSLDR